MFIVLVGRDADMKVKLIIAVLIIVGMFAYIIKKNKEDSSRLTQAAEAHQQKLEKEKSNDVKELNTPKPQHGEVGKVNVSDGAEKTEVIDIPGQTKTALKSETANNGKKVYSEDEWLSICKSTAGAANAIMSSRQKGVAMIEMMDKVVGTAEPALKDIIKAFVIEAYNKPQYNSPEFQQKSVLDFENYAYLTCIKVKQ